MFQTHVESLLVHDRAFLKAGPTLWNLVPCEIRLSPSLDSFKTNLKKFLYRDAYINNIHLMSAPEGNS
jgi:hypothetical protein